MRVRCRASARGAGDAEADDHSSDREDRGADQKCQPEVLCQCGFRLQAGIHELGAAVNGDRAEDSEREGATELLPGERGHAPRSAAAGGDTGSDALNRGDTGLLAVRSRQAFG